MRESIFRCCIALIAAVAACSCLVPPARADTHYVATNGLHIDPFTNWTDAARDIQSAVDATTPGDTVLVSNGVYDTGGALVDCPLTTRVVIATAITVQSVNGPLHTVIQGRGPPGDGAVRCAYLTGGGRLIGFTLTKGHTRTSGVWATDMSGGGLRLRQEGGTVSNCLIQGNKAHFHGGGVFVENGGIFANCMIVGNTAGQDGGGVELEGSSGAFYSCTIIKNVAGEGGGGIAAPPAAFNWCISNTIVYGNRAAVYDNFLEGDSTVRYSYCCLMPFPVLSGGGNNITNDPFLTPLGRLKSASPCIDAGSDTDAPASDLYGQARWDDPRHANVISTVDIGAFEFVDTDLDNMADLWEIEQFGTTNRNGAADDETDGLNDLQEYENSTSPTSWDTDSDQMPDGWEVAFLLDPLASDAGADADGDAFANYSEYVAGTDPTGRTSGLVVTGLQAVADSGALVFSWESVIGRTYSVQGSADLSPSSWSNEVLGVSGTGSILCYTNTNAVLRPFVRVRVAL